MPNGDFVLINVEQPIIEKSFTHLPMETVKCVYCGDDSEIVREVETVATYPKDYLRPKWVEAEYKEWLEAEAARLKWENQETKKRRKNTLGIIRS